MEDPIRFDVWAKIIPAQRGDALAAIGAQKVFPSEIELRKAINNALRTKGFIQVAKALAYAPALDFIKHSADFLSQPTLFQEGYGPNNRTAYCEKHNVHFGGCLGCHVCRGFYVQ